MLRDANSRCLINLQTYDELSHNLWVVVFPHGLLFPSLDGTTLFDNAIHYTWNELAKANLVPSYMNLWTLEIKSKYGLF